MMQFKHVAICLVLLNYSDSTSVKRAKQMRVGKRSFPLDCVERWKVMVWWCLVMHRNAQIVTASQMSDPWTLLSLPFLFFLMLSALLLPASLLSTWLRAIFFQLFVFLSFSLFPVVNWSLHGEPRIVIVLFVYVCFWVHSAQYLENLPRCGSNHSWHGWLPGLLAFTSWAIQWTILFKTQVPSLSQLIAGSWSKVPVSALVKSPKPAAYQPQRVEICWDEIDVVGNQVPLSIRYPPRGPEGHTVCQCRQIARRETDVSDVPGWPHQLPQGGQPKELLRFPWRNHAEPMKTDPGNRM